MSRISPAALTKEQLVDRWGAARAKAKKLEAEIEPLKEEFERRGLSVVAGEAWGVARSESAFSSLDVRRSGPRWARNGARSARKAADARVHQFRLLGAFFDQTETRSSLRAKRSNPCRRAIAEAWIASSLRSSQ